MRITTFEVTVTNLTHEGHAVEEAQSPMNLGRISAEELKTLLDVFVQIDPVANLKLDPEIRVNTRRDHFIIRTGQGKLFLYDARRLSEPAHVCLVTEIIEEMDGTAAARRTTVPFPMTQASAVPFVDAAAPELAPTPVVDTSPKWALALAGVAVALSAYIGFIEFKASGSSAGAELEPLPATERVNQDTALTGVYMTGQEPGHYGIVVQGGGNLKLFRVNANAAPSVVYGKYQLGRSDSSIVLSTDQPGGVIKVVNAQTLSYGGVNYERVP